MHIPSLIIDVQALCDDEAAIPTAGHLRNVRSTLELLARYMASREQAIEVRTAGKIDTAMGIEDRADLLMDQIATDGSAMVRSWDITAPCTFCTRGEDG